MPEQALPAPPAGLGAAGQGLLASILGGVEEGWELDQRELHLLERACRIEDQIAALELVLEAEGPTTKGSRGQVVVNPAQSESRQLALAAPAPQRPRAARPRRGDASRPDRNAAGPPGGRGPLGQARPAGGGLMGRPAPSSNGTPPHEDLRRRGRWRLRGRRQRRRSGGARWLSSASSAICSAPRLLRTRSETWRGSARRTRSTGAPGTGPD